jgi:hypothetical protein
VELLWWPDGLILHRVRHALLPTRLSLTDWVWRGRPVTCLSLLERGRSIGACSRHQVREWMVKTDIPIRRPKLKRHHWEHLSLSLGIALYLSRVLLEQGAVPRIWPVVVLLGLVCLASALYFIQLAQRLHFRLSPLALCYGYALYPLPNPSLAFAIGLTLLFGLVILNTQHGGGQTAPNRATLRGLRISSAKAAYASHSLVFLGGLTLYYRTLAPDVLPGDAGEFQLVSALLGVAHPPGYPLYTLLGKLFTLVPLGNLAYRVNLLSAVISALTLALVSLSIHQIATTLWPGLAAALVLGGTTTFWAQATVASARGLTALFTALILALALCYDGSERRSRRRNVLVSAIGLAFGLAVSHHGSLGFLTIPVGLFLISSDRTLITQPQRLLRPLVSALLGLSVLLYLPLRDAMGAPLGPGDLSTLSGFLEHVTAQGFRSDMFALVDPGLLIDRAATLKDILLMQFGGPLLLAVLVAIGLLMLCGRFRFLTTIGGILVLNIFVALTYRAPQTVEYLIPSYLCLSLLLGGGMAVLLRSRSSKSLLASLLSALVLCLGVTEVMTHYASFRLLHHDRSIRSYAESLLQAAPSRAVVLANWHYVTPLRYLQMVEGQRADVTIAYVNPRGNTPLPDLWQNQFDRYLADTAHDVRPVIATNYDPQFASSPYDFSPLGEAFLVERPGEMRINGTLHWQRPIGIPLRAAAGELVELIGYSLEDAVVHPLEKLVLLLAWQPLVPLDQDLSLFAHLVAADGTPLAQADIRHSSDRHHPGDVVLDRFSLHIARTVAPGEYDLIVGAYVPLAEGGWERLSQPGGPDHLSLARVQVGPTSEMPVTLHPVHRPFVGGVTLIGVDYDTSYWGSLRVYLHWQMKQRTEAAHAVLVSGGRICASALGSSDRSRSTYLSTVCDLPPGISSLGLRLLRSSDGSELSALGAWHLPNRNAVGLPRPPQNARFLSLGGEMALVGAHVDRGDQVSVRLDLLALRSLTQDYTVSLRLRDAERQWQVQSDGTPAWGAIPTLKWIRGTRVTDVRRLHLPPGADPERLELEFLVYDAFTIAPLPPLDERLLSTGPVVPLGEVDRQSQQ